MCKHFCDFCNKEIDVREIKSVYKVDPGKYGISAVDIRDACPECALQFSKKEMKEAGWRVMKPFAVDIRDDCQECALQFSKKGDA